MCDCVWQIKSNTKTSGTIIKNVINQTLVFCSKQLVNRCSGAETEPWNNLPHLAADPIRMKQNWQLRSQRQLYQVIQDTPMSFLLLSSGMQITLSMEAREKKLAHRDLLMGLRWNRIRCRPTFLDTIRYLEISGWDISSLGLSPCTRTKGAGSGTPASRVNTPMSRLLVGTGGRQGSGARLWVCTAGRRTRSSRRTALDRSCRVGI